MIRMAAALILALAATPAAAQDRPFLFSIATTGAETRGANVHFDVGTGEREFVFEGQQGIEQRIGLQAALGRGFTFVASASVAQGGNIQSGQGAGSAEALFDLLRGPDRRTTLALGGGISHEYLGTNVARVRVAAGHNFGTSLLQANVLFDKPMADTHRDTIDLITTVGWMQQLTGALSLGVEAVGEDLEGFWESNEAEGGTRLLLGPSLHIGGTARNWRLTVGGGPVFHPTASPFTSTASRTLPQSANGTGYAVQSSFAYLF